LFFNDVFGGKDTLKNVHSDSIQCLVILIVVLVSIPIGLDLYGYFKDKKEKEPVKNKPSSGEKTIEQKVGVASQLIMFVSRCPGYELHISGGLLI